MGKYCSDCTYLNPKDKKDNINGYCKCTKIKKHVKANSVACDKYSEAHSRKWYAREELYNDAKKIPEKEDPISLEAYTIIAIIVIIGAIIVNVF